MRALRVSGLALCDSDCAHCTTVVRALHRDDVLLASDHPGHLNSALDRLRSRIPEEERVQRRVGHHRDKLLDELQVGLVVGNAALWG